MGLRRTNRVQLPVVPKSTGDISSDELSLGLSSDDNEHAIIDDDDEESTSEVVAQPKRSKRNVKAAATADDDDFLKDFTLELSSDEYLDSDGSAVVFSSSDDDYDVPAEDDFDEDYDFKDALRAAGNFRQKKKTSKSKSYWKRKMTQSHNRELDPEVRMNLSLANEAFVRQDFQSALNLYLEVIKLDPKNFVAYKTVGEIYKSQGRLHECCNYWLLAANNQAWDSKFWASVAELSSELEYIDQAIYCYTRAIAADPSKNPEYILERALLYKEKKSYGRALEGFQKVLAIFPTDGNIVKNLASVYMEQKRLNDAINLYMNILDRNMNPTSATNDDVPLFDWAELNILCELYMAQHTYSVGVRIIKIVARWLQERTEEKWWDNQDDDAEFDERRFDVLNSRPASQQKEATDKEFELPIDIRFKLGVLRLELDQHDEAMRHFDFLLDEEDIADLHWETGKALEAQGYNADAIEFLNRAYENEDQRTTELLELMAKCYLELGEYQQAKDIYSSLVEIIPDNLDIKLALIEALFHSGDEERADQLLKEVSAAAKASEKDDSGEGNLLGENGDEDPMPLIRNTQLLMSSRRAKLTDEERIDLENNAKRKVLEKYHRMERLQQGIDQHDKLAATAWIKVAAQLIEMFMSVRSFFPRDKSRLFKGIILYKRKKNMGIDEKLARVYNLYEGMTETDNSRHELTSVTEYRGLTYDQWFFIFIQYSILLFQYEDNMEYAVQVIEIAQQVSVFVQDKNRSNLMRFIRLILGLRKEDQNAVSNNIRHFMVTNQFSQYIYKIFICCFSSGVQQWLTFSNYNHQKFFLRQLKAFDSAMTGNPVRGMATINADVKGLKLQRDHLEILYIYANLLGGSRSFISSIVYMTRAYTSYNRDPTLCFVLGLSHVHRAMQRMSNNRHLQLLQGISYILEYRTHRLENATVYEQQEVEYNFGRLFHMLGLPSIAVTFYDKVLSYHEKLQDPSYDLSMEAAHNLALLYNFSGNTVLAREITVKYLTI